VTSEEVLSIENDSEVNSERGLLGHRFWLVVTGTSQIIAAVALLSEAPAVWHLGGWLGRLSILFPMLSGLAGAVIQAPRVRAHFISAMERNPNPEHSQLVVRAIFSAVVQCWVYGAAWVYPIDQVREILTATALVMTIPMWLFCDIARHPQFSPARHRVGMLFDGAGLSLGLALDSRVSAIFWPGYLWVIVGQGTRFGIRKLVEATAISIIGFAVVVAVSRYWQDRPLFTASVFVALAMLPMYMGVLLSRIHHAKAAAEAANRTKSRFLAFITHELRSPLNGIIGFSEMLRQEVLGPLGTARYKEWASDINRGGEHLLALINDLLDISKAEAGRLVLEREEVDLAELAASCIRLIGPTAEKKLVTLKLDVHAEHVLILHVDALRMRQIVINLLSNAVKFSDQNSEVRVAVTDCGPDGFLVAISDTGIGMRPEDIPRALEPYGQVDTLSSRRHEGTGLGLPLARMLVESHGGRLEIESALGEGTTVKIRLPNECRVTTEQRLAASKEPTQVRL
jgi:signal transduction histidine kinase